ncbi:MAG: hypothetical protein ACRYGR_09205 [Janthinobacterium lividum]
MTFETSRRTQPMMLFVALALVINATSSFLSHHRLDTDTYHVVSYAACFDMMVTVPALYYLLVVRRGTQTFASLLLVILMCVVRASFVVPSVVHGAVVLGFAEVGILALVCFKVRRAMRTANSVSASDPMEHIEAACRAVIPVSPVARLMASEFAVLYYALFSWRPSKAKQHGQTFSTYRKGGMAVLLAVLACLMTAEIPILHIVLARWSKTIAWVFTAFGIYGFVWIIGLSRSFVLRPAIVSDAGLELSKGFLWRVQVRWTDILAVYRPGHSWEGSDSQALNLAVGVAPDLVLELTHHVVATGAFGLRKQVKSIAICMDDLKAFEASLPVHSELATVTNVRL